MRVEEMGVAVRRWMLVLLVVIGTTVSGIASAIPITIGFEGVIDKVRVFTVDPYGGAIPLGASFTGTYTYDSTASDDIPSSDDAGFYTSIGSPYGFSVTIGGIVGTSVGPGLRLNYRVLTRPSDGRHVHDLTTPSGSPGYWLGTEQVRFFQVFLGDTTESALSSTDLPLVPPSLGDYDQRHFGTIVGSSSINVIEFGGEIRRLYLVSTVPAPTTTALLALGLLGAGFARKRRTH